MHTLGKENNDTTTNEIVCKNCGHHFEGLYCSACGQKVISKRITIKHLFEITFDSFNIQRGLPFTIKLMFTKPGEVINGYLNGRTKDFYNPLKFLLLAASISALLMLWLDLFDANMENTNEFMGLDDETARFQKTINSYIKKFLQFVSLLTLPFFGLVSKWMFKKHRFYYAEHLTINSYLFAQITIIQIFVILLVYFVPALLKYMLAINSVVFISYYTYALKGVFKVKFGKSILSSVVIYVLGMFLMTLFIIIATIITMFIMHLLGVNISELMQ